jgi:hypothetical protein
MTTKPNSVKIKSKKFSDTKSVFSEKMNPYLKNYSKN